MLLVVIHVFYYSFAVDYLFFKRIGRWLLLLAGEETVASFAAASAFSFPSIHLDELESR